MDKAARGIVEQYSKHAGVKDEYNAWLDRIMPQSDDVAEYCADHPLLVPFADILFCPLGSQSIAQRVQPELVPGKSLAEKMLPPVKAAACITWTGRDGEAIVKPTNASRIDAVSGAVASHSRPSASSKRSQAVAQKQIGVDVTISNITEGDTMYIPCLSWEEYGDNWPYPYDIGNTYVEGTYGAREYELLPTSRKKRFQPVLVSVFDDMAFSVNREWIEKWGLITVLPADAVVITRQDYYRHELQQQPSKKKAKTL